jgi:vitamin-K-epoxide reductase (warfarin-sensitive)
MGCIGAPIAPIRKECSGRRSNTFPTLNAESKARGKRRRNVRRRKSRIFRPGIFQGCVTRAFFRYRTSPSAADAASLASKSMTFGRTGICAVLATLSVAGIAVSAISLYHHLGTSRSSYCDFGANFSCDMVNRSIYSEILGSPVALIGLLGYGALLTLSMFYKNKGQHTARVLLIVSLVGLAFAVYLTYVEAFLLAVWCVLCLSSLTLISAIASLSAWLNFTGEA